MKLARKSDPLAAPAAPPPPSRLGGVRPVSHDEDERQSREDLRSGETIFNRAVVPLPRFLTGKRARNH
jgi:hypothetical protein